MAPALNTTAEAAFKHPLDPLTPDELSTVTNSVRQYIATKTSIRAVKFIQCNLLPPPKRAVLAYLGIPLEPSAKPEVRVPITRKAEVDNRVQFHRCIPKWPMGSGEDDRASAGYSPSDNSWLMTRAPFVKNALWVCRDVEGEENGSERVYPAGKYVPQTRETPTDSIGNWVKGGQPTDGEDILVYFTVGTTHIPRPEDWPVMLVDVFCVTLKPVSFFKMNPSLDVPETQDHLSVPAQPTQNGHACHF